MISTQVWDRLGQVYLWFSYRFRTGLRRFKNRLLRRPSFFRQVWAGLRRLSYGFRTSLGQVGAGVAKLSLGFRMGLGQV